MDGLVKGMNGEGNAVLVWADVSSLARDLCRRHLAGPAASLGLGQSLVSAALLSAGLTGEDERLSWFMDVDGPLEGCQVEVSVDGRVRGFTRKKTMDDLDMVRDVCPETLFGRNGTLQVSRSTSRGILEQARLAVAPADPGRALSRYYASVQGRLSLVSLCVSLDAEGELAAARGALMIVEAGRMQEEGALSEAFRKGAVKGCLEDGGDWDGLLSLLGLGDMKVLVRRELRFGCSCSREKVEAALAILPADDLREMASTGEPHPVTCHFCGETWMVPPELLRQMAWGAN